MKTVGSLGGDEFRNRLESGLGMRIGPFAAHLSVRVADLAEPLQQLYQDYPLIESDELYSFRVKLETLGGLRLPGKGKVRFSVDGVTPHEDMPRDQALPVLEWGINLVVALRSHCYLMLHAAVLERDGVGLLMPAEPGQGKSTLCAGLMHRGWRLLSDEFGLFRPRTANMIPVPRPIALKNDSVGVMRRFSRDAFLGPTTINTRKGDVAHLRPTTDSIARANEEAPVRWIVFPTWRADSQSTLTEVSRLEGFMQLATNAFNYELLGEDGFLTVSEIAREARSFQFEYSDLENATLALTDFTANHAG